MAALFKLAAANNSLNCASSTDRIAKVHAAASMDTNQVISLPIRRFFRLQQFCKWLEKCGEPDPIVQDT